MRLAVGPVLGPLLLPRVCAGVRAARPRESKMAEEERGAHESERGDTAQQRAAGMADFAQTVSLRASDDGGLSSAHTQRHSAVHTDTAL